MLSLSAPERRALGVLLALTLAGSGVQLYKRYRPHALPDYILEVDTLQVDAPPASADIHASRPASGIDVNTANQEHLESLPGIGPALARRIIAERESNGPYRSATDLARVPGIGARMVERLAPYLRFP